MMVRHHGFHADGVVPILQARGAVLDEIAFCAWLAQAEPGSRLVYHRGFLCIDIAPVISPLPEQERRRLVALAAAAHRAFDAELAHLVQERLDRERFAYIAIARPKPHHAPMRSARCLEDAEAA